MKKDRLGIVIAVKDEAARILSDPFYGWEETSHGIYENDRAVLALCGIGKVFASYYTALVTQKCRQIIIMGTSGGLANQSPGDVYLCDEFCEHDMDVTGLGVPNGVTPFCALKSPVIKTSSSKISSFILSAAEHSGISLKRGRIISGDLFICDRQTNDAKREFFKADLVDMESAAVAKICAAITCSEMAALRYVSDNADHAAADTWQENVKKSSAVFNSLLKHILQNR